MMMVFKYSEVEVFVKINEDMETMLQELYKHYVGEYGVEVNYTEIVEEAIFELFMRMLVEKGTYA